MKSKKGSHVGMILSFVIFVTFLVFLYSVLQPSLRIKQDKENLLHNLKPELEEKFSADWAITTFVINTTTSKNCVKLKKLILQLPNSKLIIKNESSDILLLVRKNNNDLIINRSSLNNTFFKVYSSEEFEELINENIGSCEVISENEYELESIKTGREIFYSKINKIKNEYEANYTALKDELNIPEGSEFGFVFQGEGITIATPEKETTTSVYAEQISILYVDNKANIKSGFLIIKVW